MKQCVVWLLGVAAALCVPACAHAHDPSTYGGLFRSRNLGTTWLNADIGLFVNAALAVALDPRDPNHLLLGTDSGLVGSVNGGRSWKPEAREQMFGPVSAIAFSPDGAETICTAPSGVFRYHEARWSRVEAPSGAAPARAIAFGSEPGRVYLLGDHGLFLSDDAGLSFRPALEQPGGGTTTAFGVARRPSEVLLVVAAGRLMVSADGGAHWRERQLGVASSIDTVALDPALPARLWAAAGDHIHVSDDLGASWRIVGSALPEPETSVRGIAADPTVSTLVVTTHRGMYRSEDGGARWRLKEGNLPIHLEAGSLVRDPNAPETLYAVYSLMPYPDVWRTALEGSTLLSRTEPLSLAGGLAFLLLLIIGGGFIVVRLDHHRGARSAPRASAP